MNYTYHDKLYDEFKNKAGEMLGDVVDAYPRGRHSIEFVLKSGRTGYYDGINEEIIFSTPVTAIKINDYDIRLRFANRLNKLMSERGYGLKRLSEATDITQSTLHSYLTMQIAPNITAVTKMAVTLGCDPGELL